MRRRRDHRLAARRIGEPRHRPRDATPRESSDSGPHRGAAPERPPIGGRAGAEADTAVRRAGAGALGLFALLPLALIAGGYWYVTGGR